jgi:hypothetical protein
MDGARLPCPNGPEQRYSLVGIHQQRRRASGIQYGQWMVAERQHCIRAGQYPTVPEMHTVEKTDGELHASAPGFVPTLQFDTTVNGQVSCSWE